MVTLIVTSPLALLVSFGTLAALPWPAWAVGGRMLVDLALGIVALVLLPRVLYRDAGPPTWAVDAERERRALPAGLLLIAFLAVSGMATAPGLIAVASLAGRRRWRWIAAAVGVLLAAFVVAEAITPSSGGGVSWWELALAVVVLAVLLTLWGLYRGTRRELLRSARQEAEEARRGQESRELQARQAERNRIAREMHDTVSHRLALVALHAGALEYRDDLTPEQVRDAAGVIRQGVQEASDELRAVLAVLRDDGGDARPAPRLAQIEGLIADVREAGVAVEWTVTSASGGGSEGSAEPASGGSAEPASGLESRAPAEPPPAASAHVYRVVQESLTNALKHAPGAPLRVALAVEDGVGVAVEVRNPLPATPADAPGSRVGLVGLRERLALAGGRFGAQAEGGEFVVRAWVPWRT